MTSNIYQQYDPSWLVEAALKIAAEYPWLPDALRACTEITKQTEFYIYFVSTDNASESDSKRQYQEGIFLWDTCEGHVLLDIIKDNTVCGVELLSKLINDDNVLNAIKSIYGDGEPDLSNPSLVIID